MLKADASLMPLLPWQDGGAQRVSDPRPLAGGACPLDLIHLARQTFGDRRLESELLRLFLRQAEHAGRLLEADPAERAVGQADLELLHLLAGSARAIGATRVAALASEGEAILRRDDTADRLEAARRATLCHEIAAVRSVIADLLDQG